MLQYVDHALLCYRYYVSQVLLHLRDSNSGSTDTEYEKDYKLNQSGYQGLASRLLFNLAML